MRGGLLWLAMIAGIVLICMTSMFWLFYTIPFTAFAGAILYYIIKSTFTRLKSRPRK